VIRIDVDRDDLRELIEEHRPGWLDDAQARTAELENDSTLAISSIWSPIKRVFMNLQHSKCVFCEKEMEDQLIEQDVEHFRPKNNVRRWSVPNWLKQDEAVEVVQPDSGTEPGYRLLAYHFLNYAAACKTCNSTRKSNLFPIAGNRRASDSRDPTDTDAEQAYLIYPVGDIDADPEELIEFHGLSPQAKHADGFGRKRALITIEIFHLDDEGNRPYLFKKRAETIWILFKCLQQIDNGNPTEKAEGQLVADHLTSARSEHTNCMRCFRNLYATDFAKAKTIAQDSLSYWARGSP